MIEAVVPRRFGTGFRWLLGSSWITNLGDGVAVAAGPLLVASLTPDALLVALAAALRWAPALVFGLFAGVLSDRLDRRRIVMTANVVRAAVLTGLATTIFTGQVSVSIALIALGLLSTAEVFADNTTATLAPMLVPRQDLAVANARVQTGFITLNQLAGPPIGATLFAIGAVWPFAAQVLLVVAGVLLVSRIKLPPHGHDPANGKRSALADLAEGFKWTIHHGAVRTLALTVLIFNVTFGAAWAVLVLYALRQLGLGAVGFGLLTMVSAVGGLLGTSLYGWITRRVSLGNIMRIGLIVETLTHLGLALTTSAWVAGAILFVFGAHTFVWGTTSITVRQRAVPTHLQGRVSSFTTVSSFSGLVVGAAIGGALATNYGVAAPFWFAFVGSAVFVIALWPQMRHIVAR